MFVRSYCLLVLVAGAAAALGGMERFVVEQLVQSKLHSLVAGIAEDNTTCARLLVRVVEGALAQEPWAVNMLDSGSKLEPGILQGNIINLGAYDECLAINVKDKNTSVVIKGKYCLIGLDLLDLISKQLPIDLGTAELFFDLSKRFFDGERAETGLATCVPDSCSAQDLKRYYNKIFPEAKIKLRASDYLCQTSDVVYDFSPMDWFAIVLSILTVSLLLLSTMYDVYIKLRNTKPIHKVLLTYSVLSNGKNLMTVKRSTDQISCINGIRFISMMWVVLGHRYLLWGFFPNINYLEIIEKWIKDVSSGFILGASVSVDTFFLISGILVIYVVLLAKQQGIEFNLLHYYIHRYIRLTPALAMMVLLYATLMRYMSSGPVWPVIAKGFRDPCLVNWWQPLLYIQNVASHANLCISQSWYLAVDTQLYVLAPLVFYPVLRWPKVTLGVSTLLVFASCYLAFYISWIKQANGDVISVAYQRFEDLYASTAVRGNVWLIGAVLGYVLYKTRERKVKINQITNILAWTISLAVMAFVVYSETYFFKYPYNRLYSSLSNGFARILWAVAVSWVVFACVHGYGGFINTVLSSTAFIVLGRLTYSMYLVHVLVLAMLTGTGRVSGYFSNINMIHAFWGDLFFTTLAAVVWTLAFESPVIAVGKLLLPAKIKNKLAQNRNGTSQVTEPRQDNFISAYQTSDSATVCNP